MKSKFVLPAFLAALTAVATAGCGKHPVQHKAPKAPQPALKLAPATPIAEKKQELGGDTWDPQWDLLVEKDLPADMLSSTAARAVRTYCPRFEQVSEADKRAFWAYVFQALAGAEAGLKSTTSVHHLEPEVNVKDKVSLRPVHQEGLLQLTYEDSRRYGCDFNWNKDRRLPEHDPNRTILQPANNLACGVKIMENQIIKLGKPLLARTSYWATLQPGTDGYRNFAKQMANVPVSCGTRERRARAHREGD